MATRFEFDFSIVEGLEVARWRGDGHVDGWVRTDLWVDQPAFVGKYSMNGATGILYPTLLAMTWEMTSVLNRFALPEYDGVRLCVGAEHPYELVDWDYEIEAQAADWDERDQGFVRAESVFAVSGSRRWDRGPGAALAEVSTWQELMRLVPVGDVYNTTCLFALSGTSLEHLAELLRASSRPNLPGILRSPQDLFAVITNHEDDPDRDSVMIAGRPGLHARLTDESLALSQRTERYLQRTQTAENLAQWSAAIDDLVALTS